MRDLRDAIRQWARTPVITVVVVLSLALGIGANTAIFSLIDSLLIRPLPVRDPGRLVNIVDATYTTHGVPVFRQLADAGVFESTAAMSLLRPDISDTPGTPQRVRARRQRRLLRDAGRVARPRPTADAGGRSRRQPRRRGHGP